MDGVQVARTPLLLPSFSSKGFPDVKKILKFSEELVDSEMLISAYDKADAHDRSLSMFAEVKRECGYILALDDSKPNERNLDRLLDRYDMANDVAVPIPEREFSQQKTKHLKKIEISR